MPTVSTRLSDEAYDDLEAVVELLDEDTSTTVRKALDEGLHELRVRHAVERYQSGDVSVNEAARIADVSLAAWLEIARERNLTTQLSPEDLERDAGTAREL